ncbi:hydrolase [Actinocatenispora thailandica]|uniref:Hydrolase n=1 Tax=Actinocatenispora thailandica TaxID=227318 RepID=A0A7R7HZP8_9ACTN|nr:zinc-dependent metalloprotease [Actinocatenispora thailandica]BCJ37594.1 hydrolase [Actinocatenispora thailandica]
MTDIPFGFSVPGGTPDPNDPQQMARFLSQLQQFLVTPGSGPVNWDLAKQVATSQIEADDPAVASADRTELAEALKLADLWLDPVTTLPSGVRSTAAWTRREWIEKTLPVWQQLCDPVAGRMVNSMGDLMPEELRGQLGPMQAMVSSLGGAMFGGQLGAALASLAGEVLSDSDIGLPLGPAGVAGLLPTNLAAYGEGLELPADQVRLYTALREAAHHRLYAHVPWLRGHMLAAVETYAQGITVNREAIEEALGHVDPSNPESMQELNFEGVFTPEDTPAQRSALNRLETSLALVEGWVTHVVTAAVADRLPNVARLTEAFQRRRAEGGPAEQTFAALVGLELRPRRLREATALWEELRARRGVDGRDAIWGHPDLLPSADDFAEPAAFADTSSFDIGDMGFDLSDPALTGTVPPEAGSDSPAEGTARDGDTGPDHAAGEAGSGGDANSRGEAGPEGTAERPEGGDKPQD